MSALSWYISLGAIGLVVAVFCIYKKRRTYKLSTLIVFYLFATIITWIGESIALGTFNGYSYKPGIFPDPWADNFAGHMILNSTLWPGAALLVVGYASGFVGISLVTAFFILAEYLFVHLGIYEQHWWRYYMSIIIVVAFLLISKKWFDKIKDARQKLPRLFTFYFIALLLIHTSSVLLGLVGKQFYRFAILENIAQNIYRSSGIFAFIFHMFGALLLVVFVCVLDSWYWKLAPFIIFAVIQTIFANTNILILSGGWKLIYTILTYFISSAIFIYLEKYTLKPDYHC